MPTITELVTEVRNLINEPTAAAWSDSQLRTWINEANRDIARITRHYKATASTNPTDNIIDSVAGQAEYTLAADIIAVEQAWYDDGTRVVPLSPRHIESMDQIWGARQDLQHSYPGYFMTLGYSNGTTGITLRLYPAPSIADHEIKLLTTVLPTAIPLSGSDSSAVDVPPAWYDALADYCVFRALQRDRDPNWEQYFNIYLTKRDDMLTRSDYSNAAREVIPDPNQGYLPRWLVEPEGW